MNMNQKQELSERVEAMKKDLEAKIHRLKADSTQTARTKSEEARSELSRVKAQLDELREATRQGVDNLTEKAAARLNRLLN